MNAYLKCSCLHACILEGETEIVPLLALISASSTDLKRIQTSHSLFTEFGADKPLHHVGQEAELKFESNFEPEPPAVHLALTSEGFSRRQSKVFTAKSIAKLLGPRSSTT